MEGAPQNKTLHLLEKSAAALIFVCLAFWLIVLYTDVYAFALTGAIYEMLWLPMLLVPIFLPPAIIAIWARRKFVRKSAWPYLLAMSIGLVLFLLSRQI